jgi:adenosine deaminase
MPPQRSTPQPAGASATARTARHFETIRSRPPLVRAFLQAMPKGADLHTHIEGAIYAEDYIEWGADAGLCLDRATMTAVLPPCDPTAGRVPLRAVLQDDALYDALVDAWSTRDYLWGRVPGHDQFFAAFGRFITVAAARRGEMLAAVTSRAATQHVHYLELMYHLDEGASAQLGLRVGWNTDLAQLRAALLAAGLPDLVAETRRKLDQAEARRRELQRCGTPTPDPGSGIGVRYLYEAVREAPPEVVFAQLMLGFELAQADPRVLGVNLVAPEDGRVACRDYRLHMTMLDYLHGLAPGVNVALHAGELWLGRVPPAHLRFHIREAVERGHAKRIGHGVAVMYEEDALGLLAELARRDVLVEVNLTSNAEVLEVAGPQHPFSVYREAGVPVALSTDDEGVARIDLTHEYQRAVETYRLSYDELKELSRASLAYSFLPGANLWASLRDGRPVGAVEADPLGGPVPSPACQQFLAVSEKARAQWRLEADFAAFEKQF